MRTFNGNSIRDSIDGKISYLGIRHPLIELSYGKYMLFHQLCADGTMRKADNWKDGWSETVSLDSMLRHVEALNALHEGYFVYEIRSDKGQETVYLKEKHKLDKGWTEVTEESALNAIKFNCNAYLLEILK